MNNAGFDKHEQNQQKKSQKNQTKNSFTQNSSPPKIRKRATPLIKTLFPLTESDQSQQILPPKRTKLDI